jgi:hypothetical protein
LSAPPVDVLGTFKLFRLLKVLESFELFEPLQGGQHVERPSAGALLSALPP